MDVLKFYSHTHCRQSRKGCAHKRMHASLLPKGVVNVRGVTGQQISQDLEAEHSWPFIVCSCVCVACKTLTVPGVDYVCVCGGVLGKGSGLTQHFPT